MVLEARRLTVGYTEPVLRDVELRAAEGSVTVLLGPTGCGKTTLLLALAGLLEPLAGEVLLNGKPLREQIPAARREVGLSFQNPDDQLFNPTVFDEIAYALRSLGLRGEEVRRRVVEVAEKFGISNLLGRPPYKLSMGQKRLVALASIEVYRPRHLLLDEPLTFLDHDAYWKTLRFILEARREGRAVVVATHNPDIPLWVADHICIIRDSTVACSSADEAIASGALEDASIPKTPSLRALLELTGGWEGLADARLRLREAVLRQTQVETLKTGVPLRQS